MFGLEGLAILAIVLSLLLVLHFVLMRHTALKDVFGTLVLSYACSVMLVAFLYQVHKSPSCSAISQQIQMFYKDVDCQHEGSGSILDLSPIELDYSHNWWFKQPLVPFYLLIGIFLVLGGRIRDRILEWLYSFLVVLLVILWALGISVLLFDASKRDREEQQQIVAVGIGFSVVMLCAIPFFGNWVIVSLVYGTVTPALAVGCSLLALKFGSLFLMDSCVSSFLGIFIGLVSFSLVFNTNNVSTFLGAYLMWKSLTASYDSMSVDWMVIFFLVGVCINTLWASQLSPKVKQD